MKANLTKGKFRPILDHALFEGVPHLLQERAKATQI